jgi:hypothetical protein
MTELEVLTVSSVEFDEAPERYRCQAVLGHIVRVVEPSGAATVIMSEQDFAGFNTRVVERSGGRFGDQASPYRGG